MTDGWYSCNAHTDQALIPYIESGKITIGTKIVTCGAELVNGGSGISPLEVRSKKKLSTLLKKKNLKLAQIKEEFSRCLRHRDQTGHNSGDTFLD